MAGSRSLRASAFCARSSVASNRVMRSRTIAMASTGLLRTICSRRLAAQPHAMAEGLQRRARLQRLPVLGEALVADLVEALETRGGDPASLQVDQKAPTERPPNVFGVPPELVDQGEITEKPLE